MRPGRAVWALRILLVLNLATAAAGAVAGLAMIVQARSDPTEKMAGLLAGLGFLVLLLLAPLLVGLSLALWRAWEGFADQGAGLAFGWGAYTIVPVFIAGVIVPSGGVGFLAIPGAVVLMVVANRVYTGVDSERDPSVAPLGERR